MGVGTRRAGLGDLEALARLFDAYRQFYRRPADLALATRFLRERIERDESVIFVAEDATLGLVGFCQLYPTFCSVAAAPMLVLYDLYVDATARRAGAGQALMAAVERYASEHGYARMELQTARDNLPAQSLYESRGWERNRDFYAYSKCP